VEHTLHAAKQAAARQASRGSGEFQLGTDKRKGANSGSTLPKRRSGSMY
jgi:hypothetical protein